MSYKLIFIFLLNTIASQLLTGQSLTDKTSEVKIIENINDSESLFLSQINSHGNKDTLDLLEVIKGIDTTSTFVDQNGETVNHTFFKNKVIFLDFWHLKCKPCLVELPGIEYIDNKIKSEDFIVVTFANNSIEELESKLFSKKKFDIKIIPQTFLVSTNIYPLKVVIDKNSKIIDSVNYGNAGKNSIDRLLKKYIPLIEDELKKG